MCDKELACYFCHKLLRHKMKRHLETVHKKEPEVESIMLRSKKDRELLFAGLVCRGNFNHNVHVLECGSGQLIVSRRPTTESRPNDYVPYIFCLSFFLCKDVYAHTKLCKFKPHDNNADDNNGEVGSDNKAILGKCRMLLYGALQRDYVMSDAFRSEVFDCMRYDELAKYVKTDSLILKYGMSLFRRHGRSRHNDISQKMRMLARLVLGTRKVDGIESTATLHEMISGASFDAVVKATEIICQVDSSDLGRPLFKNPTFGVKIGHILVKCAELKKGLGIRTSSQSMREDADAFIALHKA